MVVSTVCGRRLVADAHRHIADNAGGRGGDGEVAQLHLLLPHLGLQRLQARFGGPQIRVGLFLLLFADCTGGIQFAARCCCCLASVTSASRAVRSASWLDTDAC